MTLLAYHAQPERKAFYLHRLAQHRRADHITQRIGWESNGVTRGCAVGCTLEAYDHSRYPTELGIPESIARLEDAIFEGLPVEEAKDWPGWFLTVIQPGADLSRVTPRFLVRLLARRLEAVSADANLDAAVKAQVVAALRQVKAVVQQWADTGALDASAAWSAESAAESAESAAESAESAAESAASAAWSARSAAESAARSAARSARSAAESAESAAESAEYRWMAQALLEELSAAPALA